MDRLQHAIHRLYAVLETENAALRQHDATHVAALVAEKLDAAQALTDMIAAGAAPPPGSLARLRAAIEENSTLLELALQVQGRIVALVMRAARAVDGAATGYSARGTETRAGGPIAFTTRA